MAKSIAHNFHIPVMGIGFTIDSPVKVAQYGINSVISIVDDQLVEKMRKFYCDTFDRPYTAITEKIEDFRAKRITAYLDLVDEIVEDKFAEVLDSILDNSGKIEEYMSLLPDFAFLKQKYQSLKDNKISPEEIWKWAKEKLQIGSIDVNIMTKLDKANYRKKEALPIEFNDAHAALRGFANSTVKSSIILSAGMNPRLYSYFEQFDVFYPNERGELKKKIVLKVSDYRSALIQGKFLAKKGLWVSEFRIESGLNCGGHAFATDGYLLGPILEEFKNHRKELAATLHEIYAAALLGKEKPVSNSPLPMLITAQGGVGTADEHRLLTDYYTIDSVGWGSPFLLVPEVTNIDPTTMELLKKAGEDDLYLSGISPLGVPFNSLRGNTKDIEKFNWAAQGRPGSSCPKRYLVSNKDYTEIPICTASRQYQRIKLKELNELNLPDEEYQKRYDTIIEKACLCVGLGASALINTQVENTPADEGVTVCPGPNLAYFSDTFSKKEMINHIYGKTNIMHVPNRPSMFLKELGMYVAYLQDEIKKATFPLQKMELKRLKRFKSNLLSGISYYKEQFTGALRPVVNPGKGELEKLAEYETEVLEIELEQNVAR